MKHGLGFSHFLVNLEMQQYLARAFFRAGYLPAIEIDHAEIFGPKIIFAQLRRRADDLVRPDPIRDIAPISIHVLAQPELFSYVANLSFYFFRFWRGEKAAISWRERGARVVLFFILGRQSVLVSPVRIVRPAGKMQKVQTK